MSFEINIFFHTLTDKSFVKQILSNIFIHLSKLLLAVLSGSSQDDWPIQVFFLHSLFLGQISSQPQKVPSENNEKVRGCHIQIACSQLKWKEHMETTQLEESNRHNLFMEQLFGKQLNVLHNFLISFAYTILRSRISTTYIFMEFIFTIETALEMKCPIILIPGRVVYSY